MKITVSALAGAALLAALGFALEQDTERKGCDCEKIELTAKKNQQANASFGPTDPKDPKNTTNTASASLDLHFKIQCEKKDGTDPCQDEVKVELRDQDWSQSGAAAKKGPDDKPVPTLTPFTLKGKKCNGHLDDLDTDAKGKKQSFTLAFSAAFPKGNDVVGKLTIELKTTDCKRKSAWTVVIDYSGKVQGSSATATATIKEDKEEEKKMEGGK